MPTINKLAFLNINRELIDALWREFLSVMGWGNTGNEEIPEGETPQSVRLAWEKYIYSRSPVTTGTGTQAAVEASDPNVIRGESNEAPTSGVYFYEHADFGGNSYGPLGDGRFGWCEQYGVPNDQISSMRIPPGWQVQVFEHKDFQGKNQTYRGDVKYMGDGMNDRLSSFIIRRG
jgi:hypothetical protein